MVVGIHGKKSSGKDSVATIIESMIPFYPHAPTVIKAWYATKLKQIASELSGIPIEYFYLDHLKEVYLSRMDTTPRKIMTDMHDALVPIFGEMVFVNQVITEYEVANHNSEIHMKPFLFIVVDVRYNIRETQWIRQNGGFIIHVRREETDYMAGLHSSEAGIDPEDGDVVLNNNGSLLDLEKQVREKVIPRLTNF